MSPETETVESRPKFRLRFSLLALFIFVTLVCCLLAWLVQKKQVVATALFRVSSQPATLFGDDAIRQGGDKEFEVLKNTQIALVKSWFIHNAAVRKPGIASLPTFGGKAGPPEDWIHQHLEVEFPHDAEIMRISIRGTEDQANDLIRIVDAVANAYSDEVIYKERARQAGDRDLLVKSLDDLKRKISEKSQLMFAIAKDSDRHDEATAVVLRQVNMDSLKRIESELARLESEQLKLAGGGEEGNSKFYETRIAQLRERQAVVFKALIQATEPSVELNELKAEIEQLQRTANELAIKLQKSAIDANASSRIEQIQPAVITPAD